MFTSAMSTKENVSLNIVRLIAASLVVISHVRALMFVDFGDSESKTFLTQVFYLISSLGHPAVMVFFALSGYWVGGGAIRALRRDTFTWSSYLSARLTRLWLVLIPAVLLTQVLDRLGTAQNGRSGIYSGDRGYHTVVPVEGATNFLGFSETIGNILFLQSLWVPTLGTNTPLWSLAYELWFYIMFPAGLLLFSRRCAPKRRVAAGITLLCSAVIAGPKVLLLFPIWLAGAAISWQEDRIRGLLSALGKRRIVFQALAVTATCLSAAASSYMDSRLPGAEYIVGVAAVLLVTAYTADGAGDKSFLRSVSQAAKWSYSLYAYHLPIMAFMVSFIIPAAGMRWQLSPLTVGAATVVLIGVFLTAFGLSTITENQRNRLLKLQNGVVVAIRSRFAASRS